MNLLLRMYPGDDWVFLIANVLVQVTVVIVTARLLARLGSRWNAAWRYSIYLVALLCVLAIPVLSWMMQATGITLVTLRPTVPIAPPAEAASIPMADIPASHLIETPAPPQVAASRVSREAENLGQDLHLLPENPLGPSFPDILRALGGGAVVIWLLGIALLVSRWCRGLRLIAALRRTARPLDGDAMAELLRQVRCALGADRLPPLATSTSLDRPIMVGLIRPLVILPENVLWRLHGRDLADVLVHECAHAVCRHQVVGLLQRVAGMFFWPHPLVRLLNRELARAREEVCDNYVLRRSDAPRYARTLLELSQLLVAVSPKPMALGLFHCPWRLEDRVADLLDRRRKVMIRVNRWTAAALTATFLLLGLLMAGTRVVQAEPTADKAAPAGAKTTEKAAAEKTATPLTENGKSQTNDAIPVPSCDRIDYSHPDAYLPLSAHLGSKHHILKVAATISGKTPEDKLLSIYRWIHTNLVYKADVPYYEWRDFDRLVRDGNYGGCADYSVVFGTLARACGIPTVWVKTLDADWIRDFRTRGKEGSWNGHVFLEIFIHKHWVLLDDTQLVLYQDYDPKIRILPGNRYAYDKGGDPFDLILSSQWELWKAQTRAFCRDFDLSKLPVGKGQALARSTKVAAPYVTSAPLEYPAGFGPTAPPKKYPAVFLLYSAEMDRSARMLGKILYPKLTHHFTGRNYSARDYQEQFGQWAKPGDTVILLLFANQEEHIPAEFEDLLPKSWSEVEAEVTRKGAVRYETDRRQMHVVLLAAKSPADLTSLIQKIQW